MKKEFGEKEFVDVEKEFGVIAALVEADSKDDAVQKVVEANIKEGKMCVSESWRADVNSVN